MDSAIFRLQRQSASQMPMRLHIPQDLLARLQSRCLFTDLEARQSGLKSLVRKFPTAIRALQGESE